MAAGFKGDKNICTGRVVTACKAVFKGLALGMEFSVFMVPAFADNFAVFYNNGTYQRIWICPACTVTGKFNGPAHVNFIFCHEEILADVKAVGNGAVAKPATATK